MERAGIKANELDMILFATLSPDLYFPGSGVLLQELLGISTCPSMDIRMQCSGFIYSIATADQFIKSGMYKNILVVGAENHSGGLDMSSRGRAVSVIFGDGAGAAVLTRENDKILVLNLLIFILKENMQKNCLNRTKYTRWVPEIMDANDPSDESYFPFMNGQMVFKHAITRFTEVINEGLKFNNWESKDIDLLIPHQANLRISQFVQKKFGLSDSQVYNNIMNYGNTTAASIPIALTEAWEKNRVKPGDKIVLAAFGSGFTWGSTMIVW